MGVKGHGRERGGCTCRTHIVQVHKQLTGCHKPMPKQCLSKRHHHNQNCSTTHHLARPAALQPNALIPAAALQSLLGAILP